MKIDPTQYDPDYLLPVAELATLYQRTPRSIQYWIKSGRFPNVRRIGNSYAVPWKDVLADLSPPQENSSGPG